MNQTPLRIIFAGTPEFAKASLQALLNHQEENDYELVGVYTQPDRPSGRGQKLVASPVKKMATAHNIPIFQPRNFKADEDKAQLVALNADIMIVAAYGIILPKAVLKTPRLGCINVHGSILPRMRGAAPIHRALIAGDATTGITIMQMDIGLDTGDMLFKAYCDIQPSDTAASLHDRLAILGGETLVDALERLKRGECSPEKQDNALSCYATKLSKQEGELHWNKPAKLIEREIRGFSPWPVAHTQTSQGVMKIHSSELTSVAAENATPGEILVVSKKGIIVATKKGTLRITEVQFAGGKRMKIQDALNGRHKVALQIGQRLGLEK